MNKIQNENVRCVIIEDEPQAIKLLRHFIANDERVTLLKSFRDPAEGIAFLNEHAVDILFLDINLPNISGMDLAKKIEYPISIIFTTAYLEYAYQAYEIDALDYLVKPINKGRFLSAINKYFRRSLPEEKSISNNDVNESIFIKSGSSILQVNWKDIKYLSRDENYVCFYLKDRKILSRRSIGSLEAFFPPYFIRIHKSYAVSLHYIREIESNAVKIDQEAIPIGRSYKEQFFSKINKQHLDSTS